MTRLGKSIGVVIPALDEEAAIGRVVADIPDWVDDIVVADNGSSDRTAEVARAAGARVVAAPERGYGAACQAAIAAIANPDILVFVDGDYSDRPSEMGALVDPIARGEADLALGSRIESASLSGALQPHQRFGNWLACRIIRRFWGVSYEDLGPFRAIRRDSLQQLAMTDRGYGWTVEMQIKAIMAGLAHVEVPVTYRPRIGVSKISGTLRGSVQAGITILGVVFRLARARRTGEARGMAATRTLRGRIFR